MNKHTAGNSQPDQKDLHMMEIIHIENQQERTESLNFNNIRLMSAHIDDIRKTSHSGASLLTFDRVDIDSRTSVWLVEAILDTPNLYKVYFSYTHISDILGDLLIRMVKKNKKILFLKFDHCSMSTYLAREFNELQDFCKLIQKRLLKVNIIKPTLRVTKRKGSFFKMGFFQSCVNKLTSDDKNSRLRR